MCCWLALCWSIWQATSTWLSEPSPPSNEFACEENYDLMGLLPAALAVQFLFTWAQGRAGVTGIFIIVESDVFIRFNLRRQA